MHHESRRCGPGDAAISNGVMSRPRVEEGLGRFASKVIPLGVGAAFSKPRPGSDVSADLEEWDGDGVETRRVGRETTSSEATMTAIVMKGDLFFFVDRNAEEVGNE